MLPRPACHTRICGPMFPGCRTIRRSGQVARNRDCSGPAAATTDRSRRGIASRAGTQLLHDPWMYLHTEEIPFAGLAEPERPATIPKVRVQVWSWAGMKSCGRGRTKSVSKRHSAAARRPIRERENGWCGSEQRLLAEYWCTTARGEQSPISEAAPRATARIERFARAAGRACRRIVAYRGHSCAGIWTGDVAELGPAAGPGGCPRASGRCASAGFLPLMR